MGKNFRRQEQKQSNQTLYCVLFEEKFGVIGTRIDTRQQKNLYLSSMRAVESLRSQGNKT
jgi:hypothetical protein